VSPSDAKPKERSFLTAEWRNLLMLNYEVDGAILAGRVPRGCELDTWDNRHFVSVVGFLFLDTRVRGIPIPFHKNFEEVNLRFYVRRKVGDEWRRGVVFVKEIVPRWAIAAVARGIYGENYESLPMRHFLATASSSGSTTLNYEWNHRGRWEGVAASYSGAPTRPADDAEETFITEHYWGYSNAKGGATIEYEVEHPRWNVWRADSAKLECNVEKLYGPEFVKALSGDPSTAFVADGSVVTVRAGRKLG